MEYIIGNEYLTAKIASRGAELKSLKTPNDKEYIWCADPTYWNYSSPVLFPIVGSLKNKETKINNTTYQINQHGFLRELEFHVLKQTAKEISLVTTYTKETLERYPFKFKAIITHSIHGKKIRTTFTIANDDEVNMPFNIGGHPGFYCPLYENEKFSDYRISFSVAETFKSPLILPGGILDFSKPVLEYTNIKDLPLEYSMFDIDTILIRRVKSNHVYLLNKEDKGIKFSFPKFKTLAIWSPPKKEAPYVCIEPWYGYNDTIESNGNYESKDDIINLEPLNNFNIYYEISIID